MKFLLFHFERIVREFAVNIEYVMCEFEKYRYVSNGRFLQLQKRVALLEGPSVNVIQSDNDDNDDNNIETVVEDSVKHYDVKPDDVVVQIDDNSRNVLLKSPESINDDSWVHVDNVINDI